MARGGAKKLPFYQVQVADRRSPRDGRYIERIGYFNPMLPMHKGGLSLDLARVDYWLGQGAKPTDRVRRLIAEQRAMPLSSELSSEDQADTENTPKADAKKPKAQKKSAGTKAAEKPQKTAASSDAEDTQKSPAGEAAQPEDPPESSGKDA